MSGQWLTWLDIRRLVVIILFLGLVIMATRPPFSADTGWHLQSGRITVESGHILQTDIFSHTRYGSRWVNHSWLSQVILYTLFRYLSSPGLSLWVYGAVVAAFVLVYLQMEGDPFLRAFTTVLAAITSGVIWTPRPQLVSFAFTALVCYALHLFKRRGVNRLWVLPPLFVLWVNLHAGYALGFMVIVAFLIGEVVNHLANYITPPSEPTLDWRSLAMVAGIALLSALLLVINPNTTRMWIYYLETVRIPFLREYILEWKSPDFHLLGLQPFIWLLLATMAAMGFSGRRADGTDVVTVGLFAYAALLAGRNIAPFALVTAPVLSRHLAPILTRLGWTRRIRRIPRPTPARGALHLLLVLVVVAILGVRAYQSFRPETIEEALRKDYPVDAIEWIRQHHPPGKMFNPYNWGGYLIWSLWPEYQVFVDGRTDLYGDEFLREYLDIELARGPVDEKLREYGVNLVLTTPNSPLALYLRCTGGWEEEYADEKAQIFIRSRTAFSAP